MTLKMNSNFVGFTAQNCILSSWLSVSCESFDPFEISYIFTGRTRNKDKCSFTTVSNKRWKIQQLKGIFVINTQLIF